MGRFPQWGQPQLSKDTGTAGKGRASSGQGEEADRVSAPWREAGTGWLSWERIVRGSGQQASRPAKGSGGAGKAWQPELAPWPCMVLVKNPTRELLVDSKSGST